MRRILGFIFVIALLVAIPVAIVAAGVGGDASTMDDIFKADMSKHSTMMDVKRQLKEASFDLVSDPNSPDIKAKGPIHSAVVLKGWLTVDVTFDQSGAILSYHLDRGQSFF